MKRPPLVPILAFLTPAALALPARADGADPLGTPHPAILQAVAADGRWVVMCQARKDTDGDGRIHAEVGLHGEPYGDALEPYLILGSGSGVIVHRADAYGALYWVDLATGREKELFGPEQRASVAAWSGQRAAIAGRIIDLTTGDPVATYKGSPLALDAAGRMLVASGTTRARHNITLLGPLRWITPAAAQPPPPR